MPRPRFATADADLQRRILEAATEEFAAKGYEAASLNRILLKAGLSKGSFYYYFDDKADLAAAVLATLIDEIAPLMKELGEPKDVRGFWAALRRYTDRTMDEGFGTQSRLELISKLGLAYIDHPELAVLMHPRLAAFRKLIAGFIEHGQKLKAVRNDLTADVLIATMQAAKTALASALLRGRTPTRADLDAFNDLYLDLVKRMVKP